MKSIISIVLAGGQGERLRPLTNERAKPAVPFGGHYRIVDFVLSNLVNSGFLRILVLTQFKADSLLRHLKRGWHLPPLLDQFIDAVPAQMRTGNHWYKGSADAVFQNLHHITNAHADDVCILGGDHVYRMDMRHMMEFHRRNGADVTVAVIPCLIGEATNFGIVIVDDTWRIVGFAEKPASPTPMPQDSTRSLCSMGIYIFKAEVLIEAARKDAESHESMHDFGRDILPRLYLDKKVMAYNFVDNQVPGATSDERGYWRDIGSIDSYWKASMDLVSVSPVFNLYNDAWPIHTAFDTHPPAKFVFADKKSERVGMATDSLVCSGDIISGGRINRSVLSPAVRVNSFCQVDESIIFERVNIGRHSKIRRAIIDKDVVIPPGTIIGYDTEEDRKRYMVSPNGIVVIPKMATL
ncbi:MAG: glucose-1-phosphate adenylyltransferase [Pseudomonadota bacterium]